MLSWTALLLLLKPDPEGQPLLSTAPPPRASVGVPGRKISGKQHFLYFAQYANFLPKKAKKEVRTQIHCNYSMPTTLYSLLHYTRDPNCPEQLSGPDGQSFDDNWHTAAMKAAVPSLRAFLVKCDANRAHMSFTDA